MQDILEKIDKMSVLELNELVKAIEEKFGVSAVSSVPLRQSDSEASEAKEEKTAFNVQLVSAGANKIAIIKVVKEVLGLGLKEAKDMVDAAPSMVKEGMKKDEAEALKAKIEAAGGKVELK